LLRVTLTAHIWSEVYFVFLNDSAGCRIPNFELGQTQLSDLYIVSSAKKIVGTKEWFEDW
jgi:hypothetical protein